MALHAHNDDASINDVQTTTATRMKSLGSTKSTSGRFWYETMEILAMTATPSFVKVFWVF